MEKVLLIVSSFLDVEVAAQLEHIMFSKDITQVCLDTRIIWAILI